MTKLCAKMKLGIKEKIWAPWRMEYITKAIKKDGECLFCKLAKAKFSKKNLLVHTSKHSFVVMNKYPYNNGHLMVVPKRHTKDFEGLSKEEHQDLHLLLKLAIRVVSKVYDPQGCNIGMNMGRAAGAGIDAHIHYHVVPRWNGDTNFMPVIGEVKVISEHIMDSYDRIYKAFKEEKV